jgi:hypothetical protein
VCSKKHQNTLSGFLAATNMRTSPKAYVHSARASSAVDIISPLPSCVGISVITSHTQFNGLAALLGPAEHP